MNKQVVRAFKELFVIWYKFENIEHSSNPSIVEGCDEVTRARTRQTSAILEQDLQALNMS
mgnify:CR=1 FL=1